MAKSLSQDVKTTNLGTVISFGTINIQSGGVPTSDDIPFASASLRQSPGSYRVTFSDPWLDVVPVLTLENSGSQVLHLVVSGTNPSGVYSGSVALTPPSVDFHIRSGSSNVNPQNPTKVHCLFAFKNSPV